MCDVLLCESECEVLTLAPATSVKREVCVVAWGAITSMKGALRKEFDMDPSMDQLMYRRETEPGFSTGAGVRSTAYDTAKVGM